MNIYRLAEKPEFADDTAALMTLVWPQHYGPDQDGGDALHDVQNRIREDRAAIAVQGGQVVGTVALAETSFGAEDESPWLVGLCTAPGFRGQGIASALTSWAMGRARTLGYPMLFTSTQSAVGIMKRLGWRRVRGVTDQSGAWSVWKVALTDLS